jgi:hypothetical protein
MTSLEFVEDIARMVTYVTYSMFRGVNIRILILVLFTMY